MLGVPEQGSNTQHCVSLTRLVRAMNHLTRHDYAIALKLLARVEAQADDAEDFACAVVLALHELVAAELTTLSVCDLTTGQRRVVGLSGICLGHNELTCFDRHFFDHPLVRHHGLEGGGPSQRISDRVGQRDFQRSALYGDHDHRIGLHCVIAVPLLRSPQTLVSVALHRSGRDFDERDQERLELLRPHLAFLYRHAHKLAAALPPESGNANGLTLREGQVMHWLAGGKTDAEIAALMSISPRTVQKHLEHMYVKLGVETRTAAVMRVHTSPPHR